MITTTWKYLYLFEIALVVAIIVVKWNWWKEYLRIVDFNCKNSTGSSIFELNQQQIKNS